MRALTEAAQARLTYISGARDDLTQEKYNRFRDSAFINAQREIVFCQPARREFGRAPSFEGVSVYDDIEHMCAELSKAGMGDPVVVDLEREEYRIPVVSVIVPGLECAVINSTRFPLTRNALARVQSQGV